MHFGAPFTQIGRTKSNLKKFAASEFFKVGYGRFFPHNPQNAIYRVRRLRHPPDIRIKEALTGFGVTFFHGRERHKVWRNFPNLKICNSLKFGGVFSIESVRRVCYNGCVLKRGANRQDTAQNSAATWLLHKLTVKDRKTKSDNVSRQRQARSPVRKCRARCARRSTEAYSDAQSARCLARHTRPTSTQAQPRQL